MVTARVYAIIIASLMMLGVFFWATTAVFPSSTLDQASFYLISLANLGAIYYLYATGTLGRSWPRPFYFLLLSILTLGMLFRIQHWEHAGLLLDSGLIGLAVLYPVWYLTKKRKRIADHLKALWVPAYCLYGLLRLRHVTRMQYVEYLLIGLLWVILALVQHDLWQREQQYRKNQESFSPEIFSDEEESGDRGVS